MVSDIQLFQVCISKSVVQDSYCRHSGTRFSVAVFLQSGGALLDSGISITDAYKGTVDTMTLIPLKKYFESFTVSISQGVPLGNVFASKIFPQYVSSLLLAGSASGPLGSSCVRAAHIMERDIQHALNRMTALIEPLMMVGMGLIIGSIALSIMLPIYSISSVLQH